MVVVETDYKYLYVKGNQTEHVRIAIRQDGICQGALITEFYLNNRQSLYYYRTPVIDVTKTSDTDVIQMAFEAMINDRSRWIGTTEECEHFIEIFPALVIEEKTGKYMFPFDGVNTIFQLHVTEDATGHCMMRLFSDATTDRIICDFDVSNGIDIITRAKDYVKGLSMLIEVFEHGAGELTKPTAEREIMYDSDKSFPDSMKK